MANDYPSYEGTPQIYKDDRGKSNLINHPVLAIVKDNIDPVHSGRIRVYVSNFGGIDPDNDKDWIWVNYMSPWFGSVIPKKNSKNSSDNKYGEYIGNPVSYGMWASAPDIGSTVICIFIDGRPDQGYYIGATPNPGLHHMVPAIGSATGFVPNTVEATTYADATILPVSEVNIANNSIRNSTSIYTQPKPVHSYQAAILSKQGLIRDPIRGVITSSSQRETPSRVFGISTPGSTIYTGGYTNSTIAKAAETADQSKLQVAARTGGHSIVLDDGTVTGKDQLMRFRTSAGHMIMMSDSGQSIFVIHSNGQSWVELGKEGTVDIWSSNSFNVRTLGDINLHADRDVNIHAGRNLNMFGTNIKAQSDANMSLLSAGNFTAQHGGKYSMKAAGTMSLQSSGTASFMSLLGQNYINGLKINLNSGVGPQPDNVTELTPTKHEDTVYSQQVGWMYPSPNPLVSIASRVTTHQPYSGANKGVDIQINSQVAPSAGTTSDPTLMAVNAAVPPVPNTPTRESAIATVSGVAPVVSQNNTVLSRSTVGALISQQAATASGLSESEAASRGTIPNTLTGLSVRQAETGGAIKAGSAEFAKSLLDKGLSFTEAGKVLMTGASGIPTPQSLINNVQQQVTTISQSLQTETNNLLSNGLRSILNGNQNQTAGIINAASNLGASTVTSVVNNVQSAISGIGTSISTQISQVGSQLSTFTQSITNGQFVSNLQNKLVGGVTDFATGIIGAGVSKIFGGLGGKIKSIGSVLAGLQQSAQQNFLAAQASFKALKANVPNYPDNRPEQTTSEYVALVDALSSKQNTILELEKDLISAKRAARTNPNTENEAKVIEIENLLGRNKQQLAQINAQISSINVSSTIGDIAQTGNLVDKSVSNIVSNGTNAVDTVKKLVDPNNLVGNLLGKVPQPVAKILSKVIGGGGVKQAVLAEGTARSTTVAENAKTAQLFNNPIIPPLEFGTESKDINPDDYLREQNVVLNKIKELTAKQQILETQLDQLYIQTQSSTSGEQFSRMNDIRSQLLEIENQLIIAELEYTRLIS